MLVFHQVCCRVPPLLIQCVVGCLLSTSSVCVVGCLLSSSSVLSGASSPHQARCPLAKKIYIEFHSGFVYCIWLIAKYKCSKIVLAKRTSDFHSQVKSSRASKCTCFQHMNNNFAISWRLCYSLQSWLTWQIMVPAIVTALINCWEHLCNWFENFVYAFCIFIGNDFCDQLSVADFPSWIYGHQLSYQA